jgi:hypothetical protein
VLLPLVVALFHYVTFADFLKPFSSMLSFPNSQGLAPAPYATPLTTQLGREKWDQLSVLA